MQKRVRGRTNEMKILLLYTHPFDYEINSPVITGGVEKFSQNIYSNFTCDVYQVPSSFERKKEQEKLINYCTNSDADVIISCNEPSIFNSNHLLDINKKIIHFSHMNFCMISYLERIIKLQKYGHSVIGVSLHQQNTIRSMAKRCKLDFKAYDDIIFPSYVKDFAKNFYSEYDVATIGRLGKQKDPFLVKRLLEKTDKSSVIFTTDLSLSNVHGHSDEKYILKNEKFLHDNVHYGLQHDKILDILPTIKTYFSTWHNESFGITSLEALSRGLPIILRGDNNGEHASSYIPLKKEFYRIIKKDTKQLVDAIDILSKVNRLEIAETTYEKYNRDVWVSKMKKIITEAVEKKRA